MHASKSGVAAFVKARPRAFFCAGAVLVAPWAFSGTEQAAGPLAAKVKCLRIEYRATNPVPRSRAEEGVTRGVQDVLLDVDGSRLLLSQFEEAPRDSKAPEKAGTEAAGGGVKLVPAGQYILRLDQTPPVVYRILDGGRQFTVHSGDLNDLQKDRRIVEKNQIELANRSYTAREREVFFKENYLKADGSREVKVLRADGEVILGKPCEHVVVTENGRVVVDAQVTRESVGAKGYFQLYRRLGAFSEEVLEAISKFEGLPLKGKITVVTALPAYDIEVEAVSVKEVLAAEPEFDPPPGAVRVDDVPKEIRCGWCKKLITVGIEEIPAKGLYDGKWVYFCSEECAGAFADARVGASEGKGKPPARQASGGEAIEGGKN